MRILVPDRSSVAGGTERFCLSVFPRLAELGCEISWAIPLHRHARFQHHFTKHFGALQAEWPAGVWQRAISAAARRLGMGSLFDLMHRQRVARLARETRADYLLYPWIFGETLPPKNVPAVIVVHDRNWTRFPENFSETPEQLDFLLERWMRRAEKIVAVSEWVGGDLIRRWPEFQKKMVVISHAASRRAQPVGEGSDDADAARRVRFYFPGTVSSHKGHDVLLEASYALRERGEKFTVILSGHGSDVLAAKHETLRADGILIGQGYADEVTVADIYAKVDKVVLPSLFEGFGLPLAEALAHGTPVICTDLPSFREQIARLSASRFVRLVGAGDANALAQAMLEVIRGPRLSRQERIEIAAIGARWTWGDVAKRWRDLFKGETGPEMINSMCVSSS